MKQLLPKISARRFNLSFLCNSLLLVVVFLPIQSFAQKKISTSPINKAAVPSLSHVFKNYSVFAIDAPALASHARTNAKKSMDVEFDFAGLPSLRIDIEENDILSSGYKLTVGSASGAQQFARPAVMTYKGKLADDNNSHVYLTISDQTVFGVIKGKGKEYYIEPLRYFSKTAPPAAFVVYEAKDVIPNSGTCGNTEASQKAPQLENDITQRATGTCKMVEVAIASDYSMLARYGSAAVVQERNIGIMNLMVGIYHEAQFGTQYLEFKILSQYVAAAASSNPFSPMYNGDDAGIMLTNFTGWAKFALAGFRGRYDIAQLWTATNIAYESSYGVIGLARIGGLCVGEGCQVLEDFGGSALVTASMVGHETGHNLNFQHDEAGSPYIMAPSVSDPPYTTFSPTSTAVITDYINGPAGMCLSPCIESLVAQFSASNNALCSGSSVTFTDYSIGEVISRSWQFGVGANPAASTNEIDNVTYATPGLKEITLTVSNGLNSATIKKNIVVSTPPIKCQVPGPNSTDNGVLASFTLGDINFSAGVIWIDRGIYEDKSCSDMAALLPGKTYTGSASIGTQHIFSGYSIPTKLQVMLDYNNDGDFADANESVYSTTECTEGVLQFPITIPAAPPVANKLLRLRVMAHPCSVEATDGCTLPVKSQVYDFSVYFVCQNPVTFYRDADSDGFGDPLNSTQACSRPPGYVINPADCNDNNAAINPNTQWIIDNDNDGYYTGSPVIQCTSPGSVYKVKTTQQAGDCNDNNALINPATEWIRDVDQDGYYPGQVVVQCASPGAAYLVKSTQLAGDCNDNDPAVNAGTTEVCANGKDDNCNGVIDETICIPCSNATDLTTTFITTTTATLNWVAAANPLIWEVRYKKTGSGTQWTTLPQLTGNVRSVTISSLSANSVHNWQIRAKCRNAWTKYTDVVTFTTLSLSNLEEIITLTNKNETKDVAASPILMARAMPNPSLSSFTITVSSDNKKERIMMQVVDIAGRIIETRNVNADQSIQLGERYKEGIYIVRILQGKQAKQLKLVKLPG